MKLFREIVDQTKEWIEVHKKGLIRFGIGVGTVTGAAVIYGAVRHHHTEELPEYAELPETEEETVSPWGRDCTMIFTVDETGEELGKIGCTETYAKSMVDVFCDERVN